MTDLFQLMQQLPTVFYSALAVTITGLALLIWAIVGLDRAQGRRDDKDDQARVVRSRFANSPTGSTASKAGRTSNENEAA